MSRMNTSPAQNGVALTPNDTASAAGPVYRSLYIGVSGDVRLRSDAYAEPVIYKSVAVGVLPVNCQWLYATSTTATDIVGLL
jgi:hypothetical protein